MHKQIAVTLPVSVYIDEQIAPEIVALNKHGVITVGCCQGPPATAMIQPSSKHAAKRLGYVPVFDETTGWFEIYLMTGTDMEGWWEVAPVNESPGQRKSFLRSQVEMVKAEFWEAPHLIKGALITFVALVLVQLFCLFLLLGINLYRLVIFFQAIP